MLSKFNKNVDGTFKHDFGCGCTWLLAASASLLWRLIDLGEETKKNVVVNQNEQKLKTVDEDRMYLPFWLGWFILVLQMFIYVVVFIANFQKGEPSPSDLLMGLAQVHTLMLHFLSVFKYLSPCFCMF